MTIALVKPLLAYLKQAGLTAVESGNCEITQTASQQADF
jgi:hypothetical protein